MEADGNSFNLVVKSPYPNNPDVEVSCMTHWTIGKLKEHLFHTYPGNPEVTQQRIIHMGKLLKDDHLVAKSMLTGKLNSAQLSNIIHLVCPTESTDAKLDEMNQSKEGFMSSDLIHIPSNVATYPGANLHSYSPAFFNDPYGHYWQAIAWQQQQYLEHISLWQQRFVPSHSTNPDALSTVQAPSNLETSATSSTQSRPGLFQMAIHLFIVLGMATLLFPQLKVFAITLYIIFLNIFDTLL